LIAAATQVAGCAYLLSEDLQHSLVVGPVRIISPFRVTPESLGQAGR